MSGKSTHGSGSSHAGWELVILSALAAAAVYLVKKARAQWTR